MPKASKYGVLKTGGRLSANSVVSYYGTLRTAINRAYKEGIITVNPTKEFDFASKVRQEPSRREYLTIDELKTLLYQRVKEIHTTRFPYNDFLFQHYDEITTDEES